MGNGFKRKRIKMDRILLVKVINNALIHWTSIRCLIPFLLSAYPLRIYNQGHIFFLGIIVKRDIVIKYFRLGLTDPTVSVFGSVILLMSNTMGKESSL